MIPWGSGWLCYYSASSDIIPVGWWRAPNYCSVAEHPVSYSAFPDITTAGIWGLSLWPGEDGIQAFHSIFVGKKRPNSCSLGQRALFALFGISRLLAFLLPNTTDETNTEQNQGIHLHVVLWILSSSLDYCLLFVSQSILMFALYLMSRFLAVCTSQEK